MIAKIVPEYIDANTGHLSTGLSTSPDIATRLKPTVEYVFLGRASARRHPRKPQTRVSPLTTDMFDVCRMGEKFRSDGGMRLCLHRNQ